MSKIEEMIKELCPKGVEKVKLGDVCNISRGKRVVRKDLETVGKIPVFQNSLVPLGYYSKSNCPAETTFVISAGAAGVIGISDTPFWAADDCFIVESTQMEDKFIYNFLKTKEYYLQSKIRGGAIKRLAKEPLEALEIPLPPLAIQQEIVSVLDSFTTLIDKMKKEVEMRKKQMEVYREKIMLPKKGWEVKSLGELFTFKNGINKEKKDFGIGTPIINYSDVYKRRGLHKEEIKGLVNSNESELIRYKCSKGDVFFTRTSETKEEVGYPAVLLEEINNCVFSGFLLRATPVKKLLDVEYCKYCFFTKYFRKEVIKRATLTTRALTNGNSLSKISISIPPLSVQQEIVRTLDAFETYISKLEKLITLRQKQYEYYREKLLTFE